LSDKLHLLRTWVGKIWQIYGERGAKVALHHLFFKFSRKIWMTSNRNATKLKDKIVSEYDISALQTDIEKLLENGFFGNSERVEKILTQLSSDLQQEIIAEAEKLLANKFTLYGSLDVEFKGEFSWHLDPLTGFTWLADCSPRAVATDKPEGVDIKTVWELARFQFLCPLAYAFLLTGDNRYSRYGIEKLLTWMDENPFASGPHWSRAMEAAIRLINCAVNVPLLTKASHKENYPQFIPRLTTFFVDHLLFIRTHLERSPAHTNNHYLANLVGLLAGEKLFPDKGWFVSTASFAKSEFFKEILKQFRPDGINYEGSLAYHRLSTEIVTTGILLLSDDVSSLPSELIERLQNISEFTAYYTRFSDEIPIIGDNDSGIFLKYFLGQETSCHEYLNVLLGLAMKKSPKIYRERDNLIAMHFLSPPFINVLDGNKSVRITGNFRDSGYVKIKQFDGLIIANYNREAVFFNTLNNGMWGSGGHTHNDKLSVYPIINGRCIFVDRGCYSYTGYPYMRNKDRSVASHNGPVINHWEQNDFDDDIFHLWGNAKCGREIKILPEKIELLGWHDAYCKKKPDLLVYRQITWILPQKLIKITDWFEDSDPNGHDMLMTWKFLIHPFWSCKLDGFTLVLQGDSKYIRFCSENEVVLQLSNDFYCQQYQVQRECYSVDASCSVNAGEKIVFTIQY